MVDRVGLRIRKVRESKGYSQEYVANLLNISQASYARLENQITKITLDRLFKIAEILETSVVEFFDSERCSPVNSPTQNQFIESIHSSCKDNYERLLKSKDEQILLLRQMLNKIKLN